MNDVRSIIGLGLFLVAGAVLAFGGGGAAATGVGTTAGLAGVVLLGWAWLGKPRDGDAR